LGGTYLSGSTWLGKLYKLTIPWAAAGSTYDGVNLNNYVDNPKDATNPWKFASLFDATRPVTAPPSLSVDQFHNTWVYFGTGRYFSDADKSSTQTQYLFGIKDPFDNSTRAGYYHRYDTSASLTTANLLNADSYVVLTNGQVYSGSTLIGDFNDLMTTARAQDGWMRTLTVPKERILVKPTALGGVVFVPSFVPNADICGYGGDSYLYGLFFETGTAYAKAVFDQGTQTVTISGVGDVIKVMDKKALGVGKSSSLGIHVGQEEGATGYIQQSTGTILSVELNPAFNIKSSLRSWIER
jgi:type IV pilus assembly protein PilY1